MYVCCSEQCGSRGVLTCLATLAHHVGVTTLEERLAQTLMRRAHCSDSPSAPRGDQTADPWHVKQRLDHWTASGAQLQAFRGRYFLHKSRIKGVGNAEFVKIFENDNAGLVFESASKF